jgi:hypothetical protein
VDARDRRRPVHGTTGEPPLVRFARDEAATLRPLAGRPPFRQIRELVRKVQADCAVEVDANAYSVPWRLIGESVQVSVSAGRVRIHHAGRLIAEHAEAAGRHGRIVDPNHLAGIVGLPRPIPATAPDDQPPPPPDLLRALSEYEAVAGGGW